MEPNANKNKIGDANENLGEINAKIKAAVSLRIRRKMSQTKTQVKTLLKPKTILNWSISHIHRMSLRKELVVLDWGHIERKNLNQKYNLSSQLL